MSTLYLPAWSIGPDCYKEVYEIVRPYGKKVAVIGGHTALSVAMPKLKAALEGTDLELTDPIWFGGEASYENAAKLEAMDEVKMVVEGVYSAKAAMALARKYQIEIPIIEQVNKVLFENKSPKEAVSELMLRDKKIENSQLPWE